VKSKVFLVNDGLIISGGLINISFLQIGKLTRKKTIEYCKLLKNTLSISYYRKRVYQIKKYLTYLKIDWANDLRLLPEPEYQSYKITIINIWFSL